MDTPRRAYLLLLGMNAIAVAIAGLTAMLVPAPRGWPGWTPEVWAAIATLLTAALWVWRSYLERSEGEEAAENKKVAALSLAAAPLLWAVFAVMAFWSGALIYGTAFAAVALLLAAIGYVLQPAE